jgi:heat shock protein beta
MDMIVNSLYSNREVFLRELVSNASDALDKARFNAITDGKDTGELRIRVRGDAEARTIVIEDTGVGMGRDEMLSSLGTIARSGTAKFAEAVKESKGDASLIGQFGVGFYSAFLVADRVTVASRSPSEGGSTAWQWESSAGSHSYSIKELGGEEAGDLPERGTRVTLHLKDDAAELADHAKLSALLKQYSEFIQFPIELWTSKTVYDDVEDAAATLKAQEAADAAARAEDPPREKADPVKPVMTSKPRAEFSWARQNDSAPLWTRSPKEVEKAEYDAFFKTTFKEFLDPLAAAHFSVEGTIEFTALLYVPSMAPFEQQDWLKPSRNVRLFVKRVFISDEFDGDLLPRWASFVRGIVDSADLPLNVSREILQESRVVRVIRRQLVKRTIEMLKVRKKEEEEEEEEEKEEEEGGAGATSRNSLDLEQKPHFFLLFQKSNNNPTRRRSPRAPPAPTRTTQTTC